MRVCQGYLGGEAASSRGARLTEGALPGEATLPEGRGAAVRRAGGAARRRYDAGGGASAAITSLTGAGGGGRGGDRRVLVGMIESESLGVADATTGDVKPVYIQARPVGGNEPHG